MFCYEILAKIGESYLNFQSLFIREQNFNFSSPFVPDLLSFDGIEVGTEPTDFIKSLERAFVWPRERSRVFPACWAVVAEEAFVDGSKAS